MKLRWFFFFAVPLLICWPGFAVGQETATPIIHAVRVDSTVNPVVAEYVTRELTQANVTNARAFLLQIDTPGGLDTAMRDIIRQILGSEIPVIVHVYPSGGRAASAGALILLSADFAAMASGTNAGAAHPITIGGMGGEEKKGDSVMSEKVVHDAAAYARSIARQRGHNEEWAERIVRESISTPAHEALQLKVIDVVADDLESLLQQLDGRTYMRRGEVRTLQTKGVEVHFIEMSLRQKILDVVGNPTVAYMLLMLGLLGIFFEISQPGVVLPGAIGAIALLLAFFGLQMLPVNFAGVLLILLALVLFILEVKIVSYGMLSIGGIISMTMGSLMLIDTDVPYLQISRAVMAATVAVSSAFFITVLFFVARTQRRQFFSGREGMVGERGTAVTAIDGEGRVFVHGEYWNAFAGEPIAAGEKVEVVRLADNLRLEVRRIA